MNIQSSRFGTIECAPENLLRFPSGIIGFPSSSRYLVLDHDREVPFKWLQSVDEGQVAFVIMDPGQIITDYEVTLDPGDLVELRASEDQALGLFVILTIPGDEPAAVTANLRAPIVVNLATRVAKQIILRDEHPTRYPIFADLQPAVPPAHAGRQ